MRSLHLASEYPPQQVFGLGRYVCELARELVRQGHPVHVLSNSLGGKDQETDDHGVFVPRVNFPPPPKPPGAIASVMAFNLHLQQRAHSLGVEGLGSPEIIVSHDWLTVLASAHLAKRFDLPHVWTVHDTVHGKRFGRLEDPGDRMVFELERWAAGVCSQIVVNSKSVGSEMVEVYGADAAKVRLLHCGIDAERFATRQAPSRLAAFR